MAINSSKITSLANNGLFSKSELVTLLPANSSTGLINYIQNAISQNLTKSQILSSSRYLTYIEGLGFATESFNGQTYAKKSFTTVGTSSWIIPTPFINQPAILLVVAGGGFGANGVANVMGGGGAGGLIYNASFTPTANTVTVTVGNGGQTTGSNGSNSVFDNQTAIGGGFGAAETGAGNGGGSGGGGSYSSGQGGSGTSNQGNRGGNGGSTASPYNGGGGGGAGAVGEAGQNGSRGGNGGIGLSIFGTYYAGGGGGSAWASSGSGGTGGLGGGGNGGANPANYASDGVANTGGGGGGGYSAWNGGKGGSGIVIVRYPLTIPSSFA
jgi:hypothetical protein